MRVMLFPVPFCLEPRADLEDIREIVRQELRKQEAERIEQERAECWNEIRKWPQQGDVYYHIGFTRVRRQNRPLLYAVKARYSDYDCASRFYRDAGLCHKTKDDCIRNAESDFEKLTGRKY